ncbi:hypothetical protein QPK87_09580 [Kamptonema cortianum]|nr:hypothetical protein [Kamptonema cortianum]
MIHVDDILIRSSNVECRAYGADNILWKQTRRHEYMVVSRDKELILQSFDGKTSVAGALEKLLTQGKLESIRSFYDHVSKARELGMLVPAEENSQDRSESLPTPASTNFYCSDLGDFLFCDFWVWRQTHHVATPGHRGIPRFLDLLFCGCHPFNESVHIGRHSCPKQHGVDPL